MDEEMMHLMAPGVGTLVKKDGRKVDNIKAGVKSGQITAFSSQVPIEEGDTITRVTPNGVSESYLVLESAYHDISRIDHTLPDYYVLKVRKLGIIRDELSTTQNIGTWIQGNVTNSSLVSVGMANAPVSHVVNDPALLSQALDDAIGKLVEAIQTEVKGRDLMDYVQTAQNLKAQIEERRDSSIIKKTIATLSFLDSANGTFDLMLKIWPLLQTLIMPASAIHR